MADQKNRETEAKKAERAEEAYERFLQYREMRDEEDARLASVLEAKRKKHVRVRKFAAAAAVLVVLAAFGGTMGAYARKNNGGLSWVEKNDEGMTMLTSPEYLQMGAEESGKAEKYLNRDEVPEKYKADIAEAEDLEGLEGFVLQKIEIIELGNFERVCSYFEDYCNEELKMGSVNYSAMISYSKQKYGEFAFQEGEEPAEEEWDIRFNEEEGYTICFWYGGKQYYVAGKYEPEFLEELAKEYQKYVKK